MRRLSGVYVAVVSYIYFITWCKHLRVVSGGQHGQFLRYSDQTFGKCQMMIFYMPTPKGFFKLALWDSHNVSQSWRRNAVPKSSIKWTLHYMSSFRNWVMFFICTVRYNHCEWVLAENYPKFGQILLPQLKTLVRVK